VACPDCELLMLELSYGLIDPVTDAAARSQLAACRDCPDALRMAARMQSLFASAAKLHFPSGSFTAPIVEPARATESPMKSRTWSPWAIAASVLIVAGAGGVAVINTGPNGPPQSVAKVETGSGSNGRNLVESVDGNTTPPVIVRSHDWTKAAASEAFTIKVTGNTALTRGQPNEYSILATALKSKKAKIQLTVTLTTADGRSLLNKSFTNYGLVNLPTPAGAKSPLTLTVTATDGSDTPTVLTIELPIV
jgi:hypothetical protein